MDAAAINRILDLGTTQKFYTPADIPHAIWNGTDMVGLEIFKPYRAKPRGKFTTDRISSFAAYKEFRCQSDQLDLFINPANLRATLFFDNFDADGSGNQGHCLDQAFIELKPSAEWKAVTGVHNTRLKQRALVDFLVDWQHCIANAKQLVAVFRRIDIKTQAVSGQQVLATSTTRSAFEQIEAKSADAEIPDVIVMTFVPFLELDPIELEVGITFVPTDNGGEFALRVRSLEKWRQLLSEAFASKLEEALGISPFLGEFSSN